MKTLILSLVFSFPILLLGQDWAPVNPQWSPQFSIDGGENIDFSIKIDSTIISSENTMYYLHPAYLICDTCPTPVSECTSVYDSLYLKQSALLGDSILQNGNSYALFGPDLILKPTANLGFSYTFSVLGSAGLTATITEYTEMEVFGIPDSIKTFSFSDGREMIISKNYGIISFTTEPGSTQTLSGIPELQLGDYFPGMREFYDFEVGDAFVYAGSSYSSQSSSAWLSRVDITAVLLFTDSVKITYISTGISTTWDPYPSSSSSSYSEGHVQTIAFKNQSLQGIIPGMVTYEIDSTQMLLANTTIEPTSPYYNSYFVTPTEHNGRRGLSIGGFTADFEPYNLSPFEYVNVVYAVGSDAKAKGLTCDQEDDQSNYLLNDSLTTNSNLLGSGEVFLEYTEGLGATCLYNEYGLANQLSFMIGYQKGGQVYGTVLSPGEILNTREILTEVEVKVFPNPAKSNITISIPDEYSGTFDISLTDMTGRQVLNQIGFNSNDSVDIHKLTVGTYLLFGINENVSFTRKVVVE